MNTISERNSLYTGAAGRQSLYDIDIPENWNGIMVLFIHGYMGFKDWGCWHLAGSFFVENSYGFVKYNVSHNGGTITQPIDFPDTEAFASNSYMKELEDFNCIVNTLQERFGKFQLYVIGHSRGGGIAALQSAHYKVEKWVSWAGISSIEKRFPDEEQLKKWQENTFRYVKNGRTHQELPHHYEQYEEFDTNRDRLNIESHCRRNVKPCMIIHGSEDASVLLTEGRLLAEWTKTELVVIDGAQHTFNSKHPWESNEMPDALQKVCQQTLLFFRS